MVVISNVCATSSLLCNLLICLFSGLPCIATIDNAPTAIAAADPNVTVIPSAASVEAAQITSVPTSSTNSQDTHKNTAFSIMRGSSGYFSVVAIVWHVFVILREI